MAGTLSNILGFTKRSLEDPKKDIDRAALLVGEFGYGSSLAGQLVDEQNALTVSSVFSAMKLIGESFGGLQGFTLRKNGDKVDKFEHPMDDILGDSPSELYNGFTFKESSIRGLILRGTSIIRIWRKGGEVNELELLPKGTQILESKQSRRLYFQVPDRKTRLRSDQVIYIPTFAPNGKKGCGLIHYASETIALALGLRLYGSNFFESGGTLSGFIEHPGELGNRAKNNLLNSINGGSRSAAKIGLLEEGAKYKSSGVTPKDADLTTVQKSLHADIARFLGVPLHMIQDLDRATNNNIEHQSIEWLVYFFRPWVKRYEIEINRKCFTESERKAGIHYKFNLNSLLRGDTKARAEYYKTMVSIECMNRNEVRALENMNPYKGGEVYRNPFTKSEENERKEIST